MAHMHNFFEVMKSWKRNDGALHLYALPDDEELLDRFEVAQEAFVGIDELPPMPRAWLHATVQRMAQFDDEVTQRELTELGRALTDELAGVDAFDLELGPPVARQTAVECAATSTEAWDELLTAARRALRSVWDTHLPDRPYGPHVSLAYAIGDVDDDEIASRLAGMEPLGPMGVAQVHLVSVTARPELGVFDFTSLANWDLA